MLTCTNVWILISRTFGSPQTDSVKLCLVKVLPENVHRTVVRLTLSKHSNGSVKNTTTLK